MCGISSIFNYTNYYEKDKILKSFKLGKKRGPENSNYYLKKNIIHLLII